MNTDILTAQVLADNAQEVLFILQGADKGAYPADILKFRLVQHVPVSLEKETFFPKPHAGHFPYRARQLAQAHQDHVALFDPPVEQGSHLKQGVSLGLLIQKFGDTRDQVCIQVLAHVEDTAKHAPRGHQPTAQEAAWCDYGKLDPLQMVLLPIGQENKAGLVGETREDPKGRGQDSFQVAGSPLHLTRNVNLELRGGTGSSLIRRST